MRLKVATLAAALVLVIQTACFASAGGNGGSGSSNSTVDLGTVATKTGVDASIHNADYANANETYTYQQLLFLGNLGLTFDNGQTLAEVLAQDLGPANNGTLDYNFPFTYGASGSYTENGTTTPDGSNNISITAQTQSGQVYNGHNNVGATISVNPIDAASTYDNILGGRGTQINNGFPTSTTTTVTLPPLGMVTTATDTVNIGGTGFDVQTSTVTYEGEAADTEWQSDGSITLSPIVLDLSGTGKLDACNGEWKEHHGFLGKRLAFFDFDGTGYDLLMEWVGPNAGLLVQPKADGSVDGTCLFGTTGGFNNGFEKLAILDTNKDGKLSGKELDGLMVWIDKNRDGYCDKGELHSLKELGITEINVKHSKDLVGSFTRNGKKQTLWDWWPNALNMRKMRVASK